MRTNRSTIVALFLAVAAAAVAVPAVSVLGQTTPPPGHPPIGGGQGGHPSMPQQPADPGDQGLTWTPPASWTRETPSSGMRRAQYRIPGPGGPAECVVFYFGPGQGGDVKGNIDRWASQFRRADGNTVPEPKPRQIKVGDVPVTMVEITGTYVGGMGAGPTGDRPNSMLLGAIAQGPDAMWFFRAIGPQKTLERERQAFEKMIRSIRRGRVS